MAIQPINLGGYANDGTGDDLRTAFEKVNANFIEIGNVGITGGTNLGDGAPVFSSVVASAGYGENLALRSIKAGTNVTIAYDANTITINSGSGFLFDDLNLNGNSIIGNGNINIAGNITVTSNGVLTLGNASTFKLYGGANGNVLSTDGAGNVSWIPPASGGGNLDFGSFIAPAGFSLNLGTF